MRADISIRASICAHMPLNVTDNAGGHKLANVEDVFDAFRRDFDIVWTNPT